MKVLVTGAGGFVGLNILDSLEALDYEPVGVIRAPADITNKNPHGAKRTLMHCDLGDLDRLRQLVSEVRPSYIIHAGAMTPSEDVERSEPIKIFDANERSTLGLLEAGARAGVKRFVFLSSAGVYRHRPGSDVALTEDSDLNSTGGMYALTKIASERLCGWAARTYGLDARVVRLGPVYGLYESPTTSRTRMSIVHKAVALALAGEPIRCNNPDAVYDLIFSVDAADGIVRLLEGSQLQSDTFNLAGPNVSMRTLLETIATIVKGIQVEWVDDEEANLLVSPLYRRQPLDTSRIEAELGYLPRFSLPEGLQAYMSWLNNQDDTSTPTGV